MIPLNRPYKSASKHPCERFTVQCKQAFPAYHVTPLYSSREGLNLIYKQLYTEYGSLRVAVSPLTCFIALYPIVQNGHTPIFIDIDERTFNMSEDYLCQQKNIDAVQLIYLGGNPMRLPPIVQWARQNNIIIIEDCAQALDATYRNQLLGAWGDYAVFSAVKNLHAAMGGWMLGKKDMLPSNSQQPVSPLVRIYKHIKHWLETHATAKRGSLFNCLYYSLLRVKDGQEQAGTSIHSLPDNELQDISRLFQNRDGFLTKRLYVANEMIKHIDRNKYRIQEEVEDGQSCRNRLLLLSLNKPAQTLIAELRKRGVAANNLTQNYLKGYQPHIKEDTILASYYTQELPHYETILPMLLAIPCSPALTQKEIEYITTVVNDINE